MGLMGLGWIVNVLGWIGVDWGGVDCECVELKTSFV